MFLICFEVSYISGMVPVRKVLGGNLDENIHNVDKEKFLEKEVNHFLPLGAMKWHNFL